MIESLESALYHSISLIQAFQWISIAHQKVLRVSYSYSHKREVLLNLNELVGYTMLGKTLVKMSPLSLGKFDIEDGVKLVGIVALSDFTKDYLINHKIIPNNI